MLRPSSLVFLLLLGVHLLSGVAPRPAQAASPKSGGLLRVGYLGEVRSLDNVFALDPVSRTIISSIQEGLYDLDGQGKLVPVLATALPEKIEPRHYRITLQPGVTFHDAEPFTSEDVVYTFRRVAGGPSPAPAADSFDAIDHLEAVDPQTVDVYLKYESPLLAELLARPELFPISRNFAQGQGRLYGKVSACGTGPFLIESVQADGTVSLIRNQRYWRAPGGGLLAEGAGLTGRLPYLQNILFTRYGSAEEMGEDLSRRKIHLALGFQPSLLPPGDSERWEFVSKPGNRVVQLYFHCTEPPYDDARVRRALSLAIDRKALLQEVFDGFGDVATVPFPDWITHIYPDFSPHSGTANEATFNPVEAKKLLKEAGFSSSHPLSPEFLVTDTLPFRRIAALILRHWEAAGICATASYLPKKKVFSLIYGVNRQSTPQYQVALEDWEDFRHFIDAEQFYDQLYASNSLKNKVFYEGIDALVEAASQVATKKEAAWVLEMIRDQLLTDMPGAFLIFPSEVFGKSRGLADLEWNHLGFVNLRQAWLW